MDILLHHGLPSRAPVAAPTHDTWIVNALTDGGRGGNPAAVELDADDLDVAGRLAIAARIGLSETAFVSRSDKATVRLEFFTPTRQIAHCGHATIATFALLRSLGRIGDGRLSKETIDGLRKILVDGDQVFMEQRAPKYNNLATAPALADRIRASIGLEQADVTIVDTGNRFAVVEVDGIETLRAIVPDLPAISELSEELDLIGYYVFSKKGAGPGRVATTRMFAPRYGIAEEAATGMAAGPLACLLHARHGAGETMTIEQGAFMPVPSPSAIAVRLEVRDREITGLFAGGRARVERRTQL
jgi:PhzF family phenazine biosynthesis protein